MNEAQRQAVTHGEGPLLLLAGPGSGKTFTIANRILYLLERGVPPERLLVITFTREAALSMQRRFQELCGSSCCPVNFGTFHSVFYRILQESGAAGPGGILRNSEKRALLLPILKRYSEQVSFAGKREQETADTLRETAEQILSAFSFYKNTLKLDEALKKAPARWQPYFEAVQAAYERRVREEGKTDFDDMLAGCLRLFQEDKETRSRWQNRFDHILIDEFQDINQVQYEVIKLLTRPPFNLFAVGDDDQAIYGFRGAEPDCLRRFEEEFHARRLLLTVNYRSGGGIVKASLAVIGGNKNRFHKELRAQESWGERASNRGDVSAARAGMGHETEYAEGVVCAGFMDRGEEYRYLREVLRRALEREESCAVLFRTNLYLQSAAAGLKKAGIPYEMKEKAANVYEHFIVKDLSAYLALAGGCRSRELFLRIVNKPSRYVSREAVAECGVDFDKLRAYYENGYGCQMPGTDVRGALGKLERQLKYIGGLPLRLGLEYCLKAVGYEGYLKGLTAGEDKRQEWQELLEWLKGDVAQYGSLREWQEAQEAFRRAQEQGKGMNSGPGKLSERKNPVQLMTVHGAKGLEFDRVWIPDCNEKVFPHGSFPEESTVEEERRIFYVAMTRAKISLELLYLTGTRECPRQLSRFLKPLLQGGVPRLS